MSDGKGEEGLIKGAWMVAAVVRSKVSQLINGSGNDSIYFFFLKKKTLFLK